MAILLPASALQNPEYPPTDVILNNLENLCADYVNVWRVLPKYLYINTHLWNEIGAELLPTVSMYRLEVATAEEMPPDRFSLHHDYHDPRRLGLWHQRFSNEEGEDSGAL